MDILFRVLVLIVVIAASFLLVFANKMINLSTYVWMGASLLGVMSLFIKQSWRIGLLLCPLILPALFLLFYTITQS